VRKALLMARGYPISVDEASRACASSAPPFVSGESLASYVFELLASACRREIANAHAALIEATEREIFTQAIQLVQGNQAKAARWLGVSRLTMRGMLSRFGFIPAG
jgi:DNA-binding protein Fis